MNIEETYASVERRAARSIWSWRHMPLFTATCQADAIVRAVAKSSSTAQPRLQAAGRAMVHAWRRQANA